MPNLEELIDRCEPGYGLPGEFYRDPAVYRADMDRVWRKGWVFAGHSCEIAEPGDYLTLALDTDSLIIVRDDDGSVHALHNVCRHRGTLICTDSAGRVGRLVCPYHQWTYGRDGSLLSCRGMQPEVNKDEFGLQRAHTRELDGLVFVSLADHPPNFDRAAETISPLTRSQGLDRARIAKTVDYDVAANWKLVWENNRECYHCNVNHPQYIKANFDHYNTDDTTESIQRQIDQAVEQSEQKWAAQGLAATHKTSGVARFPDAERDLWYAANRTVLVDGYVSESMDGRQVAPLMGEYTDPDVGTVRLRTMPNFWNHSSCDHSVSTRLLPAGPGHTKIRVSWLVDQNAQEGKDYALEEIMPFWQLTSQQDWELCERVQLGVISSRYRPGPFSQAKEYNVDAFVRWYLKQLKKEGTADER